MDYSDYTPQGLKKKTRRSFFDSLIGLSLGSYPDPPAILQPLTTHELTVDFLHYLGKKNPNFSSLVPAPDVRYESNTVKPPPHSTKSKTTPTASDQQNKGGYATGTKPML
jgi:hypothetical protein